MHALINTCLYTRTVRYPHIDQTTKLRAAGVAEEIMTPNPVYVTMYGMTLRELMSMRDRYPYHVFPLIDNERSRTASGVIARSDLEVFIEKAKYDGEEEGARVHFSTAPPPYHCPDNHLNASVYVDKFPVNVLPATPAERILDLFKGLGLRYCVVKDEGNRLVGVIKKKDVLLYCLQ